MRRETDMNRAEINPGLEKISEKRLKHRKSMEENNDGSHAIATRLHSKRTQFIFEFLQNAEDAGANSVRFDLSDSELQIRHNGKKVFVFDDVESITTVGNSTKEINDIGKFGVGFKAVFKITDSPIIHSGKYHFKIENYIVPEAVEQRNIGKETLFILPLKTNEYQNIKELIITGFEKTESENLLFLRNIKEVIFSYEGKERKLWIRRKEIPTKYEKRLKVTKTTVGHGEKRHRYLIIEPTKSVKKTGHKVQIALRKEKGKLVNVSRSTIFVFFPTREESGLPFLVQAPYKTAVGREAIEDFQDTENQMVTQNLAKLIADSLPLIRDIGLLSTNFLNDLPLPIEEKEDGHHPAEPYSTVSSAVIEKLKKEKLLPNIEESTYLHPEKSLFAKDEELAKLIKPREIKKDGSYKWVSASLSENIREALSIEEFTLDDLAEKIDETFISSKNDKWLNDFYGILIDEKRKELRRNLSYGLLLQLFEGKPIVRLQNGHYVYPYDSEGKLQVFEPYESNSSSSLKIIDERIYNYKNAKKFFKYLKIRKPEEKDYIQEDVLPRYKDENHKTAEKSHIKNIVRIANHRNDSDIVETLKDTYIIRTETGNYKKPNQTFLPNETNLEWFKGNEDMEPVKELKWPKQSREKIKEMFIKIGCVKNLEYNNGNWSGKQEWGNHEKSEDGFNPDFNIVGLEHSLKEISLKRSAILWNVFLKNCKHIKGTIIWSGREDFPQGSYDEIPSDSKAMKIIGHSSWLYDRKGKLIPEKSLKNKAFKDLNPTYNKEDGIALDRLVRVLGMNPEKMTFEEHSEKMKQVTEEKEQMKEQMAEKIDQIEQLKEQIEQLKKKNQRPHLGGGNRTPGEGGVSAEETWEPDREPDGSSQMHYAATPEIPTRVATPRQNDLSTESDSESKPKKTPLKVGKWGEQEVFHKLQDLHPGDEVVWMNEKEESSGPYDIHIKREGELDIFVEVKTTTNGPPHLFEITSPQWNQARKCHENGLGEYQICTVFNAGTSEALISLLENPVDRFKANELDVRPLGLRLDLGDTLE